MRPSCSNSSGWRQGESGFTLMEVVIAVTVAAILLSTIYGVFSTMSATRQRLEEEGEAFHRAQVVMQRFGRELRGHYSRDNGKSVFAGGHDLGDRFFLLLSTTAATPSGSNRGGIAKVRYRIDKDPRDDTALALFRNEWNAFEDEPEEGERRLIGAIRDFRLRFFGFGGWEDQWDEGIGAPPRAVQVSLVLRGRSGDLPFETVFEIPSAKGKR